MVWLLWSTLIFCLLGNIILLWKVFGNRRAKQNSENKRWAEYRKNLRLKTYPPPFPNTWYALFRSEELKKGEPKDKHACGLDLVVFRTSEGKPVVLDAYCPHLGAHLAFEGKIVGDCIQCPFHHWKFDKTGKCVDIPYTDRPIPKNAKVHSWPVREWGGSVYFYYHQNRLEPSFELPDLTDDLKKMEYRYWSELDRYHMHVMEMMENCSDRIHFETLHGKPNIPIVNKFVRLQHDITCEIDGPILHFTDKPMAYWNSGKLAPFGDVAQVFIRFVGPSVVVFRFVTKYWGDALFVKSSLPEEDLTQHIVDVIYAEPKMPRFVLWFLKMNAANGFEEDRPVWEHKIGRSNPMVVSGDGNIVAKRRWLRQFYENCSW